MTPISLVFEPRASMSERILAQVFSLVKKLAPHDLMRVQITKISVHFFLPALTLLVRSDFANFFFNYQGRGSLSDIALQNFGNGIQESLSGRSLRKSGVQSYGSTLEVHWKSAPEVRGSRRTALAYSRGSCVQLTA